MENQVFFKTVRRNGSSVWARNDFRRVYEIGKTYTFPEELPAHVFNRTTWDSTRARNVPGGFDLQWRDRAERKANQRVLILFGECRMRHAPCLDIETIFCSGIPSFQPYTFDQLLERLRSSDYFSFPFCDILTSIRFEVIGEICAPSYVADKEPE